MKTPQPKKKSVRPKVRAYAEWSTFPNDSLE